MRLKFVRIIKGEKGFTFLEVMAALAIMVISLVPLLENQALNVKTTARAYSTTQATLLAASKLAVYRAVGYPKQSKESGKFDLKGYEKFSYEYSQSNAGFPGLVRNVLVLRWGQNKDEKIEIIGYAVKLTER